MSKIHELYLTFVQTEDSSDCDKLVQYLKENPNSINDKDENGDTILHYAINDNSLDNVRFFLENGADPKIRDRWNNPPLHNAFLCGNPRIFDVILEYGADINERSASGDTLLHRAVSSGLLNDIKFLLRRGANIQICTLGLTEDCIQISQQANPDNTAVLQQLFKWGIGIDYEFIGKEFKSGQLDNMIILGSTLCEKPITRQTPGFEKAITNFQELEQAVKTNADINFDLLPEPSTLKKFTQVKAVAEFYEPYCKLYNNLIKTKGLKKLGLFAIQNQPEKFTIEDIQKLPNELYKQIDIRLFKHKPN